MEVPISLIQELVIQIVGVHLDLICEDCIDPLLLVLRVVNQAIHPIRDTSIILVFSCNLEVVLC